MRLISGDETLPTSLPEEMSGKFTAATKLAEAMAAAGWDGELGFQQFLYPEEKVVRKIISWLVQRLPKTGDEEGDAMQGANVQVRQLAAPMSRVDVPRHSIAGPACASVPQAGTQTRQRVHTHEWTTERAGGHAVCSSSRRSRKSWGAGRALRGFPPLALSAASR
eukprot:COSAG01_NODE_1671_length_9555_cov_12.742597_5_plen_165_part_00